MTRRLAVVAGALVTLGGRRSRDAALRGGVAYGIAAVLTNLVMKPLVHRRRPAGSEEARIGPITSSFPSGHAATDLAFVFGVSQRVPFLFPPLAACTVAAHWSLVRTRAHHLTDILAGGAVGIAVAVAVGAMWPDDAVDPPGPINGGVGKESDDERLMTRIGDEEARLLVHIEPVDEDGTVAPDPPGLPE
jgi:membrane-associated phospholipid phosphatase